MQASIWKAVFLLVAIATMQEEILATPIVTQSMRSVAAHVSFDHSIDDFDSSNSPGPVDLSATAADFREFGFMEAKASQHSTVDAFGFSYEDALDLTGQSTGVLGDSRATSRFLVTYELDATYAYEFTQTLAGDNNVNVIFFLNGKSFPTSGILQPGSYTFDMGVLGHTIIAVVGPTLHGTLSADLRLTQVAVPEGDLPGYGLLLACAIGGVLSMSKSKAISA